MDDYLSAIDDVSKDYVDNAQVVLARVMVDIRRFIWPEYTTIVLKHCSRWRFQHAEHVWNN
jgi:hypothetical protein